MGRVLTLARGDARRILSEMGFETEVTLANGEKSVKVNALVPVHHLTFDTEGQMVNSKSAHVTVSEESLDEAGFSPRNDKGEVYMRGVLATFADSSGEEKTYTVKENHADESLGIIVLILGKYAE
jgi:hypothetical protein